MAEISEVCAILTIMMFMTPVVIGVMWLLAYRLSDYIVERLLGGR